MTENMKKLIEELEEIEEKIDDSANEFSKKGETMFLIAENLSVKDYGTRLDELKKIHSALRDNDNLVDDINCTLGGFLMDAPPSEIEIQAAKEMADELWEKLKATAEVMQEIIKDFEKRIKNQNIE